MQFLRMMADFIYACIIVIAVLTLNCHLELLISSRGRMCRRFLDEQQVNHLKLGQDLHVMDGRSCIYKRNWRTN